MESIGTTAEKQEITEEVITPEEQGTEVTQPENEVYKAYKTQEEFDKEAARIRRAAEAEAQKKFLAQLKLKPGEENKISGIIKKYEASLTEDEKKAQEIEFLKSRVNELETQLNDERCVKSAIVAMSNGIDQAQVDMIVKMAKGLVSETVTMEDAVKTVIQMTTAQVQTATTEVKAGMPMGVSIVQPDTPPVPEPNPFKKDSPEWNITEQGRIWKEDPEKAKRLAALAGGRITAI